MAETLSELESKVLDALRKDPSPRKALLIAKAVGKTTAKDVNSTLYGLEKKGLVGKHLDGQTPMWTISGSSPATASPTLPAQAKWNDAPLYTRRDSEKGDVTFSPVFRDEVLNRNLAAVTLSPQQPNVLPPSGDAARSETTVPKSSACVDESTDLGGSAYVDESTYLGGAATAESHVHQERPSTLEPAQQLHVTSGPNVTSNGSCMTPNGSFVTPDGSCATPNKSCATPNGSCATPNGSCGTPNGSCGTPNGSCGTPNGSCGTPNGSCGTPNGSCGTPDVLDGSCMTIGSIAAISTTPTPTVNPNGLSATAVAPTPTIPLTQVTPASQATPPSSGKKNKQPVKIAANFVSPLSPRDRRDGVIEYLKSCSSAVQTRDVAKASGCTRDEAFSSLKDLKQSGLVIEERQEGSSISLWRLTPTKS